MSHDTYTRYRVLWPDHLGLARGKYLPRRSVARGTSFCLGVFLQGFDKGIHRVETGVDATGFPDMEADFDLQAVRPGWEAETGVVVADLSFDHRPLAISARHALRRAVADWEALGYRPQIGVELEAYLLERDEAGDWHPLETPGAFVYGTGPIADPTGLIPDILDRAEVSGIPVESLNTEFDAPQFELTLEYGDALEAIDNVFLFKELARETAAERGLKLTFLGRPFADRAGSGLHVNLSLLGPDDTNALYDSRADDGLSELAGRCIAGLLAHHEGLAALCAPTVNAYKRLVPGELVGRWANWGHDHRCTAVRVPPQRGPATRLEHRLPDGAANPYIATAAILQAARLGHLAGLERPDPEIGDGLESVNTDRRCATNLADALAALQGDRELVEAVGRELVANQVGIKIEEWRAYTEAEASWGEANGEISRWERATYLPYL